MAEEPRRASSLVQAAPRKPLYETAADAIRSAILAGILAPGQRLYEAELAKQLNLSRGPLREALRRLEQEGIVVSCPHLGSSVVRLDQVDVEDALELREYLETRSCERIIAKVTPEAVAELEQLLVEITSAAQEQDPARLAAADLAFHSRLIALADSALTERVWRSIAGVLQMSLAVTDPIFVRENGDIQENHRPILDALEAGDSKWLERALRAHRDNVKPLIDRSQQSESDHPSAT